jgi:hypothetical protein
MFASCVDVLPNPINEVKKFYGTPHQLRKMFVKDETVTEKEPGRGSVSGGFFLFLGGVGGEYQEGTERTYVTTHVRLAWEIENSLYVISTLPLDKIRIKLTEEVNPPTIAFFLDENWINQIYAVQGAIVENKRNQKTRAVGVLETDGILKDYYTPNEALSRYLAYAIITVRSADWPSNINLPVNQGYSQ